MALLLGLSGTEEAELNLDLPTAMRHCTMLSEELTRVIKVMTERRKLLEESMAWSERVGEALSQALERMHRLAAASKRPASKRPASEEPGTRS